MSEVSVRRIRSQLKLLERRRRAAPVADFRGERGTRPGRAIELCAMTGVAGFDRGGELLTVFDQRPGLTPDDFTLRAGRAPDVVSTHLASAVTCLLLPWARGLILAHGRQGQLVRHPLARRSRLATVATAALEIAAAATMPDAGQG